MNVAETSRDLVVFNYIILLFKEYEHRHILTHFFVNLIYKFLTYITNVKIAAIYVLVKVFY